MTLESIWNINYFILFLCQRVMLFDLMFVHNLNNRDIITLLIIVSVIDYSRPKLYHFISLIIYIQLVRKLEHFLQPHFIQLGNHYFLILRGLKSDHLDLLKASILTSFRGKYLIGHLYKDNEYVDET